MTSKPTLRPRIVRLRFVLDNISMLAGWFRVKVRKVLPSDNSQRSLRENESRGGDSERKTLPLAQSIEEDFQFQNVPPRCSMSFLRQLTTEDRDIPEEGIDV